MLAEGVLAVQQNRRDVRQQKRLVSIMGGEMTSKVIQGRPEGRPLGRLRAAALIAVLAGAAGSVGLTLSASRGRDLGFLAILIFAIWVFAPFAALLLAHRVATRWSVITRVTLHCLMLVLALGSLTIYVVDTVRHTGEQDAFAFVAVPATSWLLIALVIPIAAAISGRLSRQGDRA